MADNNKYYDLLKVDKSASIDDIKKAYEKLVVKHDPDKGGDREKFEEINNAYALLVTYKKYGIDFI